MNTTEVSYKSKSEICEIFNHLTPSNPSLKDVIGNVKVIATRIFNYETLFEHLIEDYEDELVCKIFGVKNTEDPGLDAQRVELVRSLARFFRKGVTVDDSITLRVIELYQLAHNTQV